MSSPIIQAKPINGGSGMTVTASQDVNPVIEAVKQEKRDSEYQDMRKVASVPVVVLYQWGKEDFGDGQKYFKTINDPDVALKLMKRLNDRDNCAFRVWEGRLGKSDFLKN